MSDIRNEKKESAKLKPTSPNHSKKNNSETDGPGAPKNQPREKAPGKKAPSKKAAAENEPADEITDGVVDKLKKGFLQAYEVGAKAVGGISQATHEYAEKYKAESEIKRLEEKKELLLTQLGHSIFKRHLEKNKITESFFNETEIADKFDQIEMLDAQIINVGKQMDKAEK